MLSTQDSAAGRTYRRLRDEIVAGTLAPGAVLAEVEQSERLGVSRTPVREALRQLAADGLAERSGRGFTVTAVSPDALDHVYELRVALDTAGAALAARRGDPAPFRALVADFTRLHAEVAEHLAAGMPVGAPLQDALYELSNRLDAAVDDAAANPYLTDAQANLRVHAARLRRLAADDATRLAASALEHRLIASAIAEGDADLAVHATHVHLHNAQAQFRAALAATADEKETR